MANNFKFTSKAKLQGDPNIFTVSLFKSCWMKVLCNIVVSSDLRLT